MSEQDPQQGGTIIVASSRFGDQTVPADSVITFPSGLIGFPRARNFVILEHQPPFSWLHSTEDSNLAFVIVDGAAFTELAEMKPPIGDPLCDFKENDEFAILVIVTVRQDPKFTTANLKAPLFVNIRNRRGVQLIFDDPKYSTRFPLWSEPAEGAEGAKEPEGGQSTTPSGKSEPEKKS